LYQVRGAGASRRLYTDGVLHSQFNPRRVVTGSVWDLLWLGLFFHPRPKPHRILLLGLGAGTVVRQLQMLFDSVQVTAVENDPVHVRVAGEQFGVDADQAQIHLGDAREFVARYRGPRFDLVIDDLFTGSGGVPRRALPFDRKWFTQLQRCLTPNGTLSVNFADYAEVKKSAVMGELGKGGRFKSGFGLRCPATENIIVSLLPYLAQSADLRAHLVATPVLAKQLQNGQLRYQARALSAAP
tara:strand:- start:1968 stop:2690 length:723 start_codon:yes stop_codon:yes gene_type:complete